MRKLIIAIVLLLFVFVGDGYSNTLVVDEQGDIFAETDRYQVWFRNGSVIHVHNKLTKETYTVSGRRDAVLSGMRGPRFDALEIDGEDYVAPEWEIGRADSLKSDVIPTIRYHHEGHFYVQHAISIVHRTNSNAEFWEELEKMESSPYREDLNFDGVVNILDLVIVANAFN